MLIGGRIVQAFAAEHPQRVNKLVLVSPDGFASPGFEYGKAPEVPMSIHFMRHALPNPVLRMTLAPAHADPAALTDEVTGRHHDPMRGPGVRDAMIARMRRTVLADPVPAPRRSRASRLSQRRHSMQKGTGAGSEMRKMMAPVPPVFLGAEMPVRLQLFDSPTMERDGGSIALPFERRSQLIVLLALKRGWVARTELASMLWPDQAPKLGFTNLRKTLFRLQGPPWGDLLESQGSSLRVEADTDVQAFEQALRAQRPADALALYRGRLLAGFDDDANEAWTGWLRFERDRLHAVWRAAALDHLVGDAGAAEGIALSARLLEADPLDEAALGAQMTLLWRAGQAARARQAYRGFVARLADELGIAPCQELQALQDALDKSAGAQAATALPGAPDPADEEGGFIGRSVERRRIAELLARDAVRLLCLTGPGGIGKTRLAQRSLHDLAPGFADGAVFVPLEDVSDAGELAARIAGETGTALRGRAATLEQLSAALSDREILLVLDNFEQLAGEASVLETLLACCPRITLIVTSRVRLGLAIEQLLPLEGLPCPESEDVDRIDAFDAARLFVSAARRVEPALVPAAEAGAIVEICRQVDGLPLALELAAAWTRVLSCEAIAAELRKGTELLRTVDPAHPARHASIELVFEQSWRWLAAAEREALARMSVFHAGFTAEAARAVAGTLLPVLGALADKSLLRKDGARLSLHPLVQQLAAARLGDQAGAETRSAHAAYFHRLLAQLQSAVVDGERSALQSIDLELENCRLAWQWSIAQGQADVLRTSAQVLRYHFDHRGRFEDGLALLQRAIGAPPLQAEPALLAMLLAEASHFEYRLDRHTEAEAMASRALAAARRHRDPSTQSRALDVLAACALRVGRLADARRHFKQVLALATAANHAHQIAASLDHLALVEKRLGHYDEALRLSLESLLRHRRIGDSSGVALCLNNLASLYQAQQDYEAARPHLHEALAICERDGLAGTRAYVLANLAEVAMRIGDLAASEAHAERALELADATGNRMLWSWTQIQLARLAVRHGKPRAAAAALAAGLGLANTLGLPALKAGGLLCFAELLYAQGELSCARHVLAFAAEHPSTGAPERDEMRAQLARWEAPEAADAAWPGLALDELLHRIVVETELAHAPLRALLRTGDEPATPR